MELPPPAPSRRTERKHATALFIIFSSPAALISVSEDISIPNVINVVKPSVVIPSVSVPSTSSWNPSAWGTWPFITISGISGAQRFPISDELQIFRCDKPLSYNLSLASYKHHLPVGLPLHPLRRHHPLRGRGLPVQQSQGLYFTKM